MNILVFGKDGQLGQAFQAAFRASQWAEQHHVRYVGRAECELSDATAITRLLDQVKPDLIINAAAYTAVDAAETAVDLAFAINARAPEILASYASQHGCTLLHYSTDYVFDGSKASPYLETDSRNPLGVYGKSKAAGEVAIERAFHRQQRNPVLAKSSTAGQYAIFRTSWVYGDGGNFIRTILRLAKERETLKVINDQYGVPTSARWLAELSLALAFDSQGQLRAFASGIYHAVPQGETTWHALACHAVQVATDAGARLALRQEAIEAIPARDYPLPAPRPMNSRMARHALLAELSKAAMDSDDMTKSQLLQESWEQPVAAYVQGLVLSKYI